MIPYPRSLSLPTTFVYVWWTSLCACFHCSAGETLSHSHVVEWIFGSRIQSHWPCMMLCPISMLSRILARLRPAVPSSQAGGNIDTSSSARLPSSRWRCARITVRMYCASDSPRASMSSARISSSSLPSSSMSSSLRWAVGSVVLFCNVVIGTPGGLGGWSGPSGGLSDAEQAVAGSRGDAGLHLHAVALGGGGQVAGAQVTHRALAQRQHAAEADAHAAPARHQHPGLLADLVQGPVAVGGGCSARVLEGDLAALA